MSFPLSKYVETPILHELVAVGGTDDVRYIYERLISYFPSLSDADISQIQNGNDLNWKKLVQKAGKSLDKQKFIKRDRGNWQITPKGIEKVSQESSAFEVFAEAEFPLTHQKIQELLLKIGEILGYYAEREFEYYDVIWRETQTSPRISHVFEVQSKGNIDSAFAKLKRAFDAQRSKPFLIVDSERDTNRAYKSLENEFKELKNVISILGFAEIRKTFDNLNEIKTYLPKFLHD